MSETAPTQSAIPARSRRQAMDWSLVLTSQSIEVAISRNPESGKLELLVDSADEARSRELIETYVRENPRRPWLPHLAPGEFEFHPAGVVWCVIMAAVFLAQAGLVGFPESGGMVDRKLVRAGEWWRLFTATFLHQDLGHLASNLTFGFLFMGLALPRYGFGVSVWSALVAGAIGNAAGVWFRAEDYRGLGASGSVMGFLGMAAMQAWPILWQRGDWKRAIASTLGGGASVFLLLGLDPRSDVIAHVGGFIGGCVLGAIFAWFPAERLRSRTSEWFWICFTLALTALAWGRVFQVH